MTLIINLTHENVPIHLIKSDILRLIEPELTKRRLKGEWVIECRFVDDVTMMKLNKQIRGINETTDVLSFPVRFATDKEDPDKIIPRTSLNLLGSIVISISTAKKQAIKHNLTINKELENLLIHGLRHLLGEDHNDEGEWIS